MTILEAQTKLEPARQAAKMVEHEGRVDLAIQEAFAMTAGWIARGESIEWATFRLASMLPGFADPDTDPGIQLSIDLLEQVANGG